MKSVLELPAELESLYPILLFLLKICRKIENDYARNKEIGISKKDIFGNNVIMCKRIKTHRKRSKRTHYSKCNLFCNQRIV